MFFPSFTWKGLLAVSDLLIVEAAEIAAVVDCTWSGLGLESGPELALLIDQCLQFILNKIFILQSGSKNLKYV